MVLNPSLMNCGNRQSSLLPQRHSICAFHFVGDLSNVAYHLLFKKIFVSTINKQKTSPSLYTVHTVCISNRAGTIEVIKMKGCSKQRILDEMKGWFEEQQQKQNIDFHFARSEEDSNSMHNC